MLTVLPLAGSYRDPAGHIYDVDGRILRTITKRHAEEYEFLRDKGFYRFLSSGGMIVPFKEIEDIPEALKSEDIRYVVEHPRLSFISHPYEWPFAALKSAALFHLDLHLLALEHGATLSDASAYNVQFSRGKAFFIDLLSFRRYREGEFWTGHRQFCEQFLNPLLLRAYRGVSHNAWYRGALEGISTQDLTQLLPLRSYASWNTLSHIFLPNYFQSKSRNISSADMSRKAKERTLPLASLRALLMQLRGWIASLKPLGAQDTVWENYAIANTYAEDERQLKLAFVKEFATAVQPGLLLDFGCNTGDYAVSALEGGACEVLGFDYDQGALDQAFLRAKEQGIAFTPLFLDAANPSPNQGWRQRERQGLEGRAKADALIALAFEHHLAIARNIPLPQVVEWLVGFAPNGIIEFVHKNDPTIQQMLSLREDIFEHYNEEVFVTALESHARIQKVCQVSSSGRKLFWYARG